ncbi:hypothetical protein QAD02_011782 [Eretmocerus hayati]|uniref:Uncharacterized protein n=1 Tax=Eretmocerus hayati TaxID=131215 RepID=A0ACC2NXW9_9HYME|nr:hypothetical protein QAD02_011782 [Eretmocerus hayati]
MWEEWLVGASVLKSGRVGAETPSSLRATRAVPWWRTTRFCQTTPAITTTTMEPTTTDRPKQRPCLQSAKERAREAARDRPNPRAVPGQPNPDSHRPAHGPPGVQLPELLASRHRASLECVSAAAATLL